MASPIHHAMSSAKKFGGVWQDYAPLHQWMDQSKSYIPDARHRAMRHHAEGIFQMEEVFGPAWVRKSDGKTIPTRWIGEQHVMEDFGGKIPTVWDFYQHMELLPWMSRGARKLSKEFDGDDLSTVD